VYSAGFFSDTHTITLRPFSRFIDPLHCNPCIIGFIGSIAPLPEITEGYAGIKKPAAGRNFLADPACVSCFMVRYPLF
jgi:hypothetical protein